MLKIAVCDDNKEICIQAEQYFDLIEGELNEKIDLKLFYCGEDIYEYMKNGEYFDIIFLDIEMEGMNGVKVGENLRNILCNETSQIIYISSKQSYAMELFKIRPMDFLIKPISYGKVLDVIKTAMRLINKFYDVFEYKIGTEIYKIQTKDILYFESRNKKINMITKNGTISFYGKLTNISDSLKKLNFIRIHKSYLVNYIYVVEFCYDSVLMSNKVKLSISEKNRKEVKRIHLMIKRNEYK